MYVKNCVHLSRFFAVIGERVTVMCFNVVEVVERKNERCG